MARMYTVHRQVVVLFDADEEDEGGDEDDEDEAYDDDDDEDSDDEGDDDDDGDDEGDDDPGTIRAKRKSPAELDRDIAQVLGTRPPRIRGRGGK